MWQYTGSERPEFAEDPGPGQESVWDYPRPPALEASNRKVLVRAGGIELARSSRCHRAIETASPPTWYIPAEDVNTDALVPVSGSSFCEWKGAASYWGLTGTGDMVGWSYPEPTHSFAAIRGAFSFYPGRVECFVDSERVRPQPGQFYGGWVTDEIVGPMKGEPGTSHW
jgi:uncharacterized protein (DUF427 family)